MTFQHSIGRWSLVKIESVKNQQIVLNSELNSITANYTVMCTGSYDELEKAVYKQIQEKANERNKDENKMNKELIGHTKQSIIEKLQRCTKDERKFFRRMYGYGMENKTLTEVINKMDSAQLDRAMAQISATIKNNQK